MECTGVGRGGPGRSGRASGGSLSPPLFLLPPRPAGGGGGRAGGTERAPKRGPGCAHVRGAALPGPSLALVAASERLSWE